MNKKPLRIKEIKEEGKNIRTFFFEDKVFGPTTNPGEFFQAWIPEYGEKPFSLSYRDPFGLTIRRIEKDPSNPLKGRFTNRAFELKEGDYMWLTGPSGEGFPAEVFDNSNVCIVGGGTGIIPLAPLAEGIRESNVISFLGVKTADEMIMERRFKNPVTTTDDGSYREKGLVTDALKRYDLRKFKPDVAAVCGPEKMMYKAAEILEDYIPPEDIYLCIERLMKCGVGLCGACDFGGYRTCVDGPVFTYWAIKEKKIPDFGKFKRDRCGRKEML